MRAATSTGSTRGAPGRGEDEPRVEILDRQRRHAVDRLRIRRAARAALRAGGGRAGGVVTVLLAGDRKLRQLNRDYRGKDRATDVLSFPSGEPCGRGRTQVGDIAVSIAEAARQAEEERCSLDRVVERLVVHGVLHLLGFDHEVDDGEMMKLQASILAGLTP